MRFAPGIPRHPNSGRKKGSGNKKKIRTACEVFAELDISPAEEIFKLIQDGDLSDFAKAQLWMQLLPFVQAKPKDDDGSESDDYQDGLREVSTGDLLQFIKSTNEPK